MIRFENVNEALNIDKFWQFEVLDEFNVRFTWGRRGTAGQTLKKSYATFREMQATLEQSVKDKLGKGYLPVGGPSGNGARSVLPPSDRAIEVERGLRAGIDYAAERAWARDDQERERLSREQADRQRRSRGRGVDWGRDEYTVPRYLKPPVEVEVTVKGGGAGGAGSKPLINAAEAMKGLGRAMTTIMGAGMIGGGGGGGGSVNAPERYRGGPRAGQPRRDDCSHAALYGDGAGGYTCRTCGDRVGVGGGPPVAPAQGIVVALKVKRKIVLE